MKSHSNFDEGNKTHGSRERGNFGQKWVKSISGCGRMVIGGEINRKGVEALLEKQKAGEGVFKWCNVAVLQTLLLHQSKPELLGGRQVVKGRENSNNSEEFEYLVSEFGWKARRLAKEDDEMRKVAAIQAEAFHIPVLFFDDVFFEFFKAEVLSGLLYKLRNSPPNRYACLVAEPNNEAIKSQNKLVGVVDVTVLRDEDVLQRLHGAEEYLYVSGLAVSKTFRRRKIGSVLLKACDMLAIVWGFKYLALRAYEEDYGARKLYSKSGYEVVSGDPPWMSTWIGRKRRVLMIKRVNNFA
ncbi:hypothetical protein Patl1_07531 [Pistacia atlantica]|uniref:Uncharacterized protein n=1 Tax=Pistacia atlantica TaxID=434234 RepID=A0ACC1AKS6_9ROSI|nr:hypothetical protein Patl1_07531 [Pistacia atlantica]